MGAVICDAMLQAGLSYELVVAPRVRRLVSHWPTADTTSSFVRKVDRYGVGGVLVWEHPTKLDRIGKLAGLLMAEGVETVEDLHEWLLEQSSALLLMGLPGVGPKTADYLRLLAGIPTIAVDRHLWALLREHGQCPRTYEAARELLLEAAKEAGLMPDDVDRSVWCSRSRGVAPKVLSVEGEPTLGTVLATYVATHSGGGRVKGAAADREHSAEQ